MESDDRSADTEHWLPVTIKRQTSLQHLDYTATAVPLYGTIYYYYTTPYHVDIYANASRFVQDWHENSNSPAHGGIPTYMRYMAPVVTSNILV